MSYLKQITSPDECPYHHPDIPYCSKAKITCFSNVFPKECPLEYVSDEEMELEL